MRQPGSLEGGNEANHDRIDPRFAALVAAVDGGSAAEYSAAAAGAPLDVRLAALRRHCARHCQTGGTLQLAVARDEPSALVEQLAAKPAAELRRSSLRVEFAGEAGVDAGGLRRDLFAWAGCGLLALQVRTETTDGTDVIEADEPDEPEASGPGAEPESRRGQGAGLKAMRTGTAKGARQLAVLSGSARLAGPLAARTWSAR